MRCDNYKKWINDALDGTLSEKQKLEFEKHLDSCSDCARETEEGSWHNRRKMKAENPG